MKVVVLLSGGIDSTVTLFFVRKKIVKSNVYPLVFNYGQLNGREIECAKYQVKAAGVKRLELVDLRGFGRLIGKVSLLTGGLEATPYVPFRNLVLLSITCSYAEVIGAEKIYYGANLVDFEGFWDCRPGFVESVNKVVELSGKKIVIEAPLITYSKADVIKLGIEFGVDFSKTRSCYEKKEKPCGKCLACQLREKAFKELRVEDPLLE